MQQKGGAVVLACTSLDFNLTRKLIFATIKLSPADEGDWGQLNVQSGVFIMGNEQRKEKRVALQKEVLINGTIKVQSLDLSVGGLYVHTGRHFTPGHIVNLTLPLNARYMNLRARVQHTQESVGMGLKFVNLTTAQEADLQTFIDSMFQAYSADARKTVLLVDDHETARRMNKSRLILDGFNVLEAKDGGEAVVQIKRERVDLVILDLYPEQVDGYNILEIIRQRPECKGIPVLALSGKSSESEMQKATAAGATEFLVKMMTPPLKLSQRVKAYLAGSH